MVAADNGSELSDGYLSLELVSDAAKSSAFLIRSADCKVLHSLRSWSLALVIGPFALRRFGRL